MSHSINQKKRMFFLEGNIGVGKSTFLTLIKNHLNVEIVLEPTEKWQHVNNDGNILDLFYKDTKRWAYTFQSYAFISRIKNQSENNASYVNNTQILERSIYCDRFCFAKNCFEMGLMSKLEWHMYTEWFDWLVEKQVPQPSGFIYLQAKPEICFQRLKKRSRSEESEISLHYLESLHKKHEEWLIDKMDLLPSIKDLPILIIDCSMEFEKDKAQQEKILNQVDQFINKATLTTCLTKKQKYLHTEENKILI